MVFTINGENWILQFVRPNSEKLCRSDGVYTLGVTDNNAKTVSIARSMSDYMTNKVLCHEYVQRTNPEMTRNKLIEELGKCDYSAKSLIFGFQNVVDGSTRI